MQLSINVNGVAQATGEMREALLAGAGVGLEKVGLRGVALIQEHTPVGATGNLFGGVFAEFHQESPMYELIGVHPPADVYASPVETGTAPHFPPTSALLLWVQKKLHITDEKHALSVAFAIAKTIARRGTKGAHMFDQAFQQLQAEATGIMEREIAVAMGAAGFGSGA